MSEYFSKNASRPSDSGTDAADLALKATAVAAGLALGIEILRHRRLLFAAAVATGVTIAVRKKLSDGDKSAGRSPARSASYPGDYRSASTQQPQDAVDEAAMESFPASDAPGSTRRNPVSELPDA